MNSIVPASRIQSPKLESISEKVVKELKDRLVDAKLLGTPTDTCHVVIERPKLVFIFDLPPPMFSYKRHALPNEQIATAWPTDEKKPNIAELVADYVCENYDDRLGVYIYDVYEEFTDLFPRSETETDIVFISVHDRRGRVISGYNSEVEVKKKVIWKSAAMWIAGRKRSQHE